MKNIRFLSLVALSFAIVSAEAISLKEDFGGAPMKVGSEQGSWSRDVSEVFNGKAGTIFFEAKFSEALPPLTGRRSVLALRTNQRFSICWNSYGNQRLQFSFGEKGAVFYHDIVSKIEIGRTYRLGATWDGDVVRAFVDGVCVYSAAQPVAIPDVSKTIFIGPFRDRWIASNAWADDVEVGKLRLRGEALDAAKISEANGIAIRPLVETARPLLVVPPAPMEASWPQLIHEFPGKSGSLPPHSFSISYDDENFILKGKSVMPGGIPVVEGLPRTDTKEPEPYGSESWEFRIVNPNDVIFRFGANYAGGYTEWRGRDTGWNGKWTYQPARNMQIDDSIHWIFTATIPWKTLEFDGVPTSGEYAFNYARSWTLANYSAGSCLEIGGKKYGIYESVPKLSFGEVAAFALKERTDPMDGEYHQKSTITACKAADTVYKISLARLDGKLAPMTVYKRERKMAAGEVANDEISFSTAIPGYDAILHELTDNGRVVMRAIVPYELSKKKFTVKPLLLGGKIIVQAKRPLNGVFKLINPSGKVVDEKPAIGKVEFGFKKDNEPGKWKVALGIKGSEDEVEIVNYPGLGEWARQDFKPETVLPPFTPLVTKADDDRQGFTVSMFARDYHWGKTLLPTGIKSLGVELLAGPVELLVNGQSVECSKFAIVSNAPNRVGFNTQAVAGGISIAGKSWIEYDGVQWNEFSLETSEPVNTVQMRFRLKGEVARYLHASTGTGWGSKVTEKIAAGERDYGAFTSFWVGDEEKGLDFFFESRAGWTGDASKTYSVVKTADEYMVTVNIANKLKAGAKLDLGLGFIATPIRPKAKTYPYNLFGWTNFSRMNRTGAKHGICDACEIHTTKGGDLGSFFADQDTDDARKTEWAINEDIRLYCKDYNVRPIFYTSSRYLSIRYPEVAAFINEWSYMPHIAMDYQRTGHYVYDCCPTTQASDYFVYHAKGLLKRIPELKGIFLDFGLVHPCSNADHGCRERTPYLAMREFHRRLTLVQLELGIEDPLVVIHNTDCVQPPAITFVTHLENGEHIRQESSSLLHNKKDILDSYGIEMFASELSTEPWGNSNAGYFPYDRLIAKNGGDEALEPYVFRMSKASLTGTLVHGSIHSVFRQHIGMFDKIVRFYERFGVEKAKFLGYWKHPAVVKSGKDVYVSCYKRDDGKVLAVVSHIAKEHLDQEVEIDFSPVVSEIKSAVDLMTAEDPDYAELFKMRDKRHVPISRAPLQWFDFGTKILETKGTSLRLHLPFHTFALIELN